MSASSTSKNMANYHRLQQALQIGLRRQIFFAVCDNVGLRDRISQQLHAGDMARPSPLVKLTLDVNNPNFLSAIATFLKQNPHTTPSLPHPTFEIVGIEELTRQGARVQQLFIRTLRRIERHLKKVEFSLLLWVSKPWFNNIRQSVPEFWQWHTGIFEFTGEQKVLGHRPTSPQYALLKGDRGTEVELRDRPNSAKIPPSEGTLTGNEEEFPRVASKTPPVISASVPEKRASTSQQREPVPQTYSRATMAQYYLQIAHQYRDRIAKGEADRATLTEAIQAYEQALQYQETFPIAAEIYNDLGNFYWLRSRRPDSPEQAYADLEQALFIYQEAIATLSDRTAMPQTYAMIQNNLGAAYGDLARYRDLAANLRHSIAAYEEALYYRTAENNALKYGSTQNNLGTAYWHLAQHENPPENLQAAIAAYTEAGKHYDPEGDPLNWAMIQNNLGTAYWNLSQHEKRETHLRSAIDCYEKSSIYRTGENAPVACAATQNNLGTAYWHLTAIDGLEVTQKQDYLERALESYQIATQLAHHLHRQIPPVKVNFNFLGTYNNLGLVSYQLATEEQFSLSQSEKLQHLETALQAHLQALINVAQDSENYQTALNYIIRTVRAFYKQGGIEGQNLALSQVPGQLLPQLLPNLG
ncbi:tetratricopeptide repeat protein [Spirulina sp. 06S082]|uniref:tetratricopeptide repeat protein n=1 Tax=Spirulina sp. 06S082 TaxID=3110248 RepID=UPI002B21A841|nr:tetratricopeptide repeat protein [Spirulina sp. 06S082]MEA5469509.1 tetratricopeptide repeat protein [Spirulina sp. 06S082]